MQLGLMYWISLILFEARPRRSLLCWALELFREIKAKAGRAVTVIELVTSVICFFWVRMVEAPECKIKVTDQGCLEFHLSGNSLSVGSFSTVT